MHENNPLLQKLLELSKQVVDCYKELSSLSPDDDDYGRILAELKLIIAIEKQEYDCLSVNDCMARLSFLLQGPAYSVEQLRLESKLFERIHFAQGIHKKYNEYGTLGKAFNYKVTIEALKKAYLSMLDFKKNASTSEEEAIADDYIAQFNNEKYFLLCVIPLAEEIGIDYEFDILKMPTIPRRLFDKISPGYIKNEAFRIVYRIMSSIQQLNNYYGENNPQQSTYKAIIQLGKISVLLSMLNHQSLAETYNNVLALSASCEGKNEFLELVIRIIEEYIRDIRKKKTKQEELLIRSNEIDEVEAAQKRRSTNSPYYPDFKIDLQKEAQQIITSMDSSETLTTIKLFQDTQKTSEVYALILERQLYLLSMKTMLDKVLAKSYPEETKSWVIKAIIIIEQLLDDSLEETEARKLESDLTELLNKLDPLGLDGLKTYVITYLNERKNISKIYKILNIQKEG